MTITIEELSSKLKNDVVRIGGECDHYQGLNDCFIGIFRHHELAAEGDVIVITDELTGDELIIERCDFFTIEIL